MHDKNKRVLLFLSHPRKANNSIFLIYSGPYETYDVNWASTTHKTRSYFLMETLLRFYKMRRFIMMFSANTSAVEKFCQLVSPETPVRWSIHWDNQKNSSSWIRNTTETLFVSSWIKTFHPFWKQVINESVLVKRIVKVDWKWSIAPVSQIKAESTNPNLAVTF